MDLSRFLDASEGGVLVLLMIHLVLFIGTVKDILISLLQKMGLKAKSTAGTPQLADQETQLSYSTAGTPELADQEYCRDTRIGRSRILLFDQYPPEH